MKALCSMLSSPAGKRMLSSLPHPAKVPRLTDLRPTGRVMDLRRLQLWKQDFPTDLLQAVTVHEAAGSDRDE